MLKASIVAATIQIKNYFTSAVYSILIQLVPCFTAAEEAPNSVSATVFTASICNVTFIDICGTTKYFIIKIAQNLYT